ncbi:MAG: glycosyltransferase family 39 protein [Alphaproteobacteria bacterium]
MADDGHLGLRARLQRLAPLFAIAFAVRALYAFAMVLIDGDAALMSPDSHGFAAATGTFVRALERGAVSGWDWLGPELDRMPIPHWLMALTTAQFGQGGIFGYVLLQGAIDAATCVAIAATAAALRRDLFRPAAVVAVLNPTMIAVSGLYLTDTVFVFFVAVAFLAVARWLRAPDWSWALAIGMALGLAGLSRTMAVAFIPVLALAMAAAALVLRGRLLRRLAQAAAATAVAAACFAPILARNVGVYGAWAVTPQSGVHMLLWQASLVREGIDGTPFAEAARQALDEFDARNPDLDRSNPFVVSAAMQSLAVEKLAAYGPAAIARAWAKGAIINLAAPAATVVPTFAALSGTSFYETRGDGIVDKIGTFLFDNASPLYAWIVGLGILGVAVLRLVQLRGLWIWLRTPGARLFLGFAALWVGFVLAVNGPVASPKYRLPIEPMLAVACAFGLSRRRPA